MKYLLRGMMLALLLAITISIVNAQDDVSATPDEICEAAMPATEPESRQYSQAEDILEVGVDYQAVFCTDAGAIYIDLFEDFTPITVNNFVFLAQNGYYNNIVFHRVIEDFMAQGGDPTGTGSGGPGYQFQDEFHIPLTFDRTGLLAMANAGAGTNGSQFFITTALTPHLNYKHTIFGEVLEGYETVENILLRDPSAASPATTLETVVIITEADSVDSEAANRLGSTDAESVVEGLNTVSSPELLPPDLIDSFVDPEIVTMNETPDILADNGHEYRVTVVIPNGQCNEQYFFDRLDYTVDLLESATAVNDVMASDELEALNADAGYTPFDTAFGVIFYQSEAESDCSDEAVSIRAHLQRGPYLITIDVLSSLESFEEAGREVMISTVLANLPRIFEGGLAAVYRTAAP